MTWVTVTNPDGSQLSYDDGNTPPPDATPTPDAPPVVATPPSTNDGTAGQDAAAGYQGSSGASDGANPMQQDWMSLAVASGALPKEITQSIQDSIGKMVDPRGGYGNFATADTTPSKKEPTLLEKVSSAFDTASAWGKQNKDNPLLKMALDGIAGAQKNSYDTQRLAQAQQYKLDQMNEEARIARDKIAANSASVSGIPKTKGIIASQLTRIGGAHVFKPNGQIV